MLISSYLATPSGSQIVAGVLLFLVVSIIPLALVMSVVQAVRAAIERRRQLRRDQAAAAQRKAAAAKHEIDLAVKAAWDRYNRETELHREREAAFQVRLAGAEAQLKDDFARYAIRADRKMTMARSELITRFRQAMYVSPNVDHDALSRSTDPAVREIVGRQGGAKR